MSEKERGVKRNRRKDGKKRERGWEKSEKKEMEGEKEVENARQRKKKGSKY